MNPPHLNVISLTADLIRGAFELESTGRGLLPHRLPAWAREEASDPQLSMVESQPSGVRLAFRSTSTHIELDVFRSRNAISGIPERPDGVIELVVDGRVMGQAVTSGGLTTSIDMATGATENRTGPNFTARFEDLPPVMKDIEIWLPHNEMIEVVQLRTDEPIESAPTAGRPVWLHHGSSISHGSNATNPTEIWPAVATRLAGVELTNLGLGGSALLDPFTARVMRDAPADLISVKIGINLVNADLMRMRAFGPAVHGFIDTIREGHPFAPILVISPIFCAIHEHTPGPLSFDMEALAAGELRFSATGDPEDKASGKLTLETIRDRLAAIVGQRQLNDSNLFYLDGCELYGEADSSDHPLPDGLHPDATTHLLIGQRFWQRAFGDGAPFGQEIARLRSH